MDGHSWQVLLRLWYSELQTKQATYFLKSDGNEAYFFYVC